MEKSRGGFTLHPSPEGPCPCLQGTRVLDRLRQLDSHSESLHILQVVVRSRFPFYLRIIVMSKNRSALKIIAEIILMIVIFGIATLFTNRGNINDKKPLTEQPSPNSTSSFLDET